MLTENFSGILNASGAVISAVRNTLDLSGNITATDYIAFEYNATGNLTKQTTNNTSGATILALGYDGTNTATGTLYISGMLSKRYVFYHNTAVNKTGIADLIGEVTPFLG